MSKIEVGYVVWGFLLLIMVVPDILAYFGKGFVPFPCLAKTIKNLSGRWPLVLLVVLAGLSVLAVHLVFYPWPSER